MEMHTRCVAQVLEEYGNRVPNPPHYGEPYGMAIHSRAPQLYQQLESLPKQR